LPARVINLKGVEGDALEDFGLCLGAGRVRATVMMRPKVRQVIEFKGFYATTMAPANVGCTK